MTRQENILTLNEHLDHWKRLLSEKICDQDEGEKTIDALQNAIKALEQEPSYNSIKTELKPCDDAIRRQDLREPRFIIAENDYQKGWNDALESVYENAPSIQPQPKMGQWIRGFGNTSCICSECHGNGESCYRFCQHCGCKMQEVEG